MMPPRLALTAAVPRRAAGLATLLVLTLACPLQGQAPGEAPELRAAPTWLPIAANTPAQLAEQVLGRFEDATPVSFDSIYPDARGREVVRMSALYNWPRRAGDGEVVRVDGDRAVLRLTGALARDNSGDATIFAREFSGLYEAVRAADGWRLGQRLPADAHNRILRHDLAVALTPGIGLAVHDTLTIAVGDLNGFWFHLNQSAKVTQVLLDGRPVEYRFRDGLFWIRAPRAASASLALAYSLDVAADSGGNPNSGRFTAEFGHLRNQYFWHPFFDFHSGADAADFRITVRAPATHRVVTSVPQRDSVTDSVRTVIGESHQPTFALSLFYDSAWVPDTHEVGTMRAELFTTPDFEPSRHEVEAALERTYRVLRARFDEPSATYLAVVQPRARTGIGWQFRSNDVIATGQAGGATSRGGVRPRAYFGHEAAHGWTHPTGAGANFLSEGWAMFAEALLVRDEFGAAAEERYWEALRADYHTAGHEGTASLLVDANNSGVSYDKGAWVLRMLEDEIGSPAFDAGMRAYMAIPAGALAGVEEFMVAMSSAAGRDVGPFLGPWLRETTIPLLDARVQEGRVIVAQRGPLFRLTLPVELTTAAGPVRRTLQLTAREDTLDVRDLRGVTKVRLDPDRRLFLHRTLGETVRFELTSPRARSVQLGGNFSRRRFEAVRDGDRWVVDLPLSEGTYAYWWWVDDRRVEPPGDGARDVRPVAPLTDPLPD